MLHSKAVRAITGQSRSLCSRKTSSIQVRVRRRTSDLIESA
jgi:hypothetical protein